MKEKLSNIAKLNITERIFGLCVTSLLIIAAILQFVSYTHSKSHFISLESVQRTEQEDGSILYSIGGISLPKGDYILNIGYLSNSCIDFKAYLSNDGETINQELPITGEEGNVVSYDFRYTFPKDSGRIAFYVPQEGDFRLVFVQVESNKHIYTDGLIYGLLMLIGIMAIWVGLIKYSKSNNKASYFVAILAVFVTTIPVFLPGGSPLGVDLMAHLFRIEGVYFGLMDHQFPVIIYPQWNNNYGQLGILYPNMFLYIPALLRIMGVSIYGVNRLSILMVNIVSAIVFYKAADSVFDKQWMKILTFLLLTFEYTRMYGVFNGGKLGGALLAEIFIPLIIAGLINLFYKDKNKWYYIAIGLAGVFCCHIISAVISCLMIFIIVLFNVKKLSNKTILTQIGKSVLLFLLLVFGSYASFLNYYFVDWSSANLAWSVFTDKLWRISKPLFDPRWNSVIVNLIFGGILLAIIKVRKSNLRETYSIITYVTAIIFFCLSTVYFPWEYLRSVPAIENLTDMLQSGNRFIGMVGELCAFSIPSFVNCVATKRNESIEYNKKTIIVAFFAVILLCIVNDVHACGLHRNALICIADEVAAEIEYEAEDYLPTGTMTEYYKSDAGYISNQEIVSTLEYSRAGSHILYKYTAKEDGEYVEFPKFFYPGYSVVDENNMSYVFFKGSNNRIRVNIPKTEDVKSILIRYDVPIILSVLYFASFLCWIMVIVIIVRKSYEQM